MQTRHRNIDQDNACPKRLHRDSGFTLVELLVATVILVLILTMTIQITNYTGNLWQRTRGRIDAFQEARAAFESMTRKISQAMLNTYWGYNNPNNPTSYVRQSELRFISGPAAGVTGLLQTTSTTTHAIFFQAPLGYSNTTSNATLPNLLNVCGYYVRFSNDQKDRPTFLSGNTVIPYHYRFRLKEMSVAAENVGVYYPSNTATDYPPDWIANPLQGFDQAGNTLSNSPERTLAENVIALMILPQRSPNDPAPPAGPAELAPNYIYDTQASLNPNSVSAQLQTTTSNQLPPVVQVTMVAIDEASAARLQVANNTTMPTFKDSAYLPGGLSSLFQTASTPAGITAQQYGDQFRTDLGTLEKALVHLHITYKVYSTNVSILQAKWSN